MQDMTTDPSRVVDHLGSFSSWLTDHSGLGYGLRYVDGRLWDEVGVRVISSPRDDLAWYEENLALVDSYLAGATMFRYPQVLGDRFSRSAMLESVGAGLSGGQFPLEQIVRVERGHNHALTGTRQRVRAMNDPDDVQWTADRMHSCC